MRGIKQATHKNSLAVGRMALTLGRGKISAIQSGQVSVAALFDCAVERQVVTHEEGWFEFGSARLGRSRKQSIDFLKRNRLLATSLQRSVLNRVLKAKQGGGTPPWKMMRISRTTSGLHSPGESGGTQRRKIIRISSVVQETLSRLEPSPAGGKQSTAEDPINKLYDDLASLTADQMAHPMDVDLPLQVSSKLAQLRDLQEAEAAVIQQRFLGSLSVPLGTLQNLLNPTREFSGRDEDPAVADETPEVAD